MLIPMGLLIFPSIMIVLAGAGGYPNDALGVGKYFLPCKINSIYDGANGSSCLCFYRLLWQSLDWLFPQFAGDVSVLERAGVKAANHLLLL